jgi:hypothetical protein
MMVISNIGATPLCRLPAAFAPQYLQLQQKYRAAERQLKSLTSGQQQQQQQQSGGDSSEGGSPPARPDVAAAQDASPHSGQQQHKGRQQPTAASSPPQRRKRAGSAAAGAGAAGAAAAAGASWPALCAELEGEVEGLKAQLAEAHRAADASQQQVCSAYHSIGLHMREASRKKCCPLYLLCMLPFAVLLTFLHSMLG